jgi:hypothetical protein
MKVTQLISYKKINIKLLAIFFIGNTSIEHNSQRISLINPTFWPTRFHSQRKVRNPRIYRMQTI